MANSHIGVTNKNAVRAQELMNMVSYGTMFRNAVRQLKASMAQYGGDAAAWTAIETDFGLPAGIGQTASAVIGSGADELAGLAPSTATANLLDRFG